MNSQKIIVAHSPDSDDAFMFYALAKHQVDTEGLDFDHVLSDIETLNRKAKEGCYEVSAISFHAFPEVADRYALLSSGSSMGDGYGPMVISREPRDLQDLKKLPIAIPGRRTTAYLALRLFEPQVEVVEMPFDEILPAVSRGEIPLGLIIHEGQLTYAASGVHKLVDLGEWWFKKTEGLPLPLGGNVVRRDLGLETCQKVSRVLRRAIQHSLDHREAALDYALSFSRGMERSMADRFVGMYVNALTVDYGERGRKALHRLYDEAVAQGLLVEKPPLEFL